MSMQLHLQPFYSNYYIMPRFSNRIEANSIEIIFVVKGENVVNTTIGVQLR